MKVLALYLPQFHEIPENNEWWGKGYTEWDAVKNAKEYYIGHQQPMVPLNHNYYDLSDETARTWKWQADLAKKFGVYGFCIYHYWFKTGEQLLEKPMEILLKHKEINVNYCICWANETWRRTWYGVKKEILKEQEYGEEDEWTNHFYYLLNFFRDKRYILIDNKPVVCIYRTYEITKLKNMVETWNRLARENGFSGVYIISGNIGGMIDKRYDAIDAYYNYEPGYTYMHNVSFFNKIPINFAKVYKKIYNQFAENKKFERIMASKIIYDNNTKRIHQGGKKCYLGTFTRYDDTPRRQNKGAVYDGTVEEFAANLKKISNVLKINNRRDDFVFVTAWNEWGEGAYLEPDEAHGYAYLEALKSVVEDVDSEE